MISAQQASSLRTKRNRFDLPTGGHPLQHRFVALAGFRRSRDGRTEEKGVALPARGCDAVTTI